MTLAIKVDDIIRQRIFVFLFLQALSRFLLYILFSGVSDTNYNSTADK